MSVMNSDVDKNQKIADERSTQSSKSKFRTFLSNAKWAYSLAFSTARTDSILTIVIYTVRAIIPTVVAFYTGKLIDYIVSTISSGAGSISELPWNHPLIMGILLVSFLQLSSGSLRIWEKYLDKRLRIFMIKRIEQKMFSVLTQIDIQTYEDPKLSNAIQKGRDNLYRVRDFFVDSLEMFANVVAAITSSYFAFTSAPIIAILVVIFAIPNNIFNSSHVKRYW